MKKIKYWLPAIFLMIIIFIGSHDMGSGQKSGFLTNLIISILNIVFDYDYLVKNKNIIHLLLRKLAHVTEYFLLYHAYYYALSKTLINNKKIIYLSALLSFIYAISDELHQTFIPSRVGTINDVIIDSFGILLAFLTIVIFKKIIKK